RGEALREPARRSAAMRPPPEAAPPRATTPGGTPLALLRARPWHVCLAAVGAGLGLAEAPAGVGLRRGPRPPRLSPSRPRWRPAAGVRSRVSLPPRPPPPSPPPSWAGRAAR